MNIWIWNILKHFMINSKDKMNWINQFLYSEFEFEFEAI